MRIDNITDDDAKEVIILGRRVNDNRGSIYEYIFGVIHIIAQSNPCHFHMITVYKKNGNKPSYKNKTYRRRRYMKRRGGNMPCSRCGKAELEEGVYPLLISGEEMGKFEGYRCPNCGLTFYKEEASRKIGILLDRIEVKPISPTEMSLILLTATDKPIHGAISFMKELFLLFEEKFKKYRIPAISPQFISYHYGPYSFDIVEGWRILEYEGYIERRGRSSSNKESFSLTRKGRVEAERLFSRLPEELKKELPDWRRGLDELGNDGILKDVYIKFPEYTDKSKIRNKVLPSGMRGRA